MRLRSAIGDILMLSFLALFLIERGYVMFLRVPAEILLIVNVGLALFNLFILTKYRGAIERTERKILMTMFYLFGSIFLLYLYFTM